MKREPKTYQVVHLDEDENRSKSYRHSDEMTLGTWFLDLFPDEKEDITMKLTDVFQSNIPLISSNLFEFVKSCRRSISTPTACNDFRWDFGHIKSLPGQGKVYVRFIVPTHVVTENVSDEESSLETSDLGSTTTSSYDFKHELCIIFEKYFAFNQHITCRTSAESSANFYHTKHRVNE